MESCFSLFVYRVQVSAHACKGCVSDMGKLLPHIMSTLSTTTDHHCPYKQLPNYTAQNDQSLWMVKKPHYQAKKEEKNTIYFIKLLHDGKQVEERSVPP